MINKKNAKVTLVGAGPGDVDLITVKGVKALGTAAVVLYDALINRELLAYAPNAIKIFVGKRKGFHRYSQDEINEIIVKNAFEHGHVVRLKGGDPFIFGRGGEEIDYVASFGIETEVVSGISSSVSVPANLGISLTKRRVSESLWILTGTTSERQLSEDIKLAAQSSATVVILMGMSKLTEITALFKESGKSHTPTVIIQNGCTENQQVGLGTIETIVDVATEKGLSSPAIIVIGEVVKESVKFRSFFEEINQHVLKHAAIDKRAITNK
ncbi:MAG: uroporphyrinogen-III C-methyltransferase [Flavobacteriaceae bacterium]|nr:uroporphyrinogen-III C-methyltransferase [Flavobacteriaceae bacterium]